MIGYNAIEETMNQIYDKKLNVIYYNDEVNDKKISS